MIPFWRVMRPTKSTYGTDGSTPWRIERIGGRVGLVEVGVDPVVDDVDALRADVEQAQHVLARLATDRDDRVGRSRAPSARPSC